MPIDSYGLGAAMILITNVLVAFLKAVLPAQIKANESQYNAILRVANVGINFGLIVGYVSLVGQFNQADLPSYGMQAALQAAGANTVFLFLKGGDGKPIPTNTPLAQGIEAVADMLGQPSAKQPVQNDPAANSSVMTTDTEQTPTVLTPTVSASNWLTN